ncbi:hypothetical protein J6V85_00400 [Candidatus Saccharibacteria bacterium]|nr:hypothetical protein [Candidatus Saccharibacteria bacterium]
MFKNKYFVMGIIIFFATSCVQDVFADGYSMTVTTGGPQSIDVVLGSDSKGTSISEDEITVNTTCRYGYNLTIGTTVNDNNLYLNGDSSNNTSGSYISPLSAPTALSEATNSWGYYFNRSAAPTASSTFSPVPASGSASVIPELTTPSSSNISDSFSVYYGVTVTQPAAPTAGAYIVPGTYKMIEDSNHDDGAIVYYFTMANNCIPYTINFSPTSTSTGSSISGTGTMPSQEGYKDVPVTIPQSSFTPPSEYVFIGWNTEQDGSGDWYDGGEEVTDLASPGETITLYAIWWRPLRLYDTVASLVKTYGGSPQTQTVADMRAVIIEPTSSNPATDTSNSGVFLYDASTFGTASDASNDYDIYYYRGIIDSNLTIEGTYAFNNNAAVGDSAYYPNYVKLDNGTCWRIIRTTGSGGVKMIYNGIFGNSTGGSCGNSGNNPTTKTQLAFNANLSSIVHVGYTYNDSIEASNSRVPTSTVFGSNENYSTINTTDSDVKDYIENTWYASNMTDYTNILEPSAGYCNDRSTYFDDGDHTPTATSSVWTTTSGINGTNISYGSNIRSTVTLSCPRGTVDLYTTSSANNGNNQLKYPVAMLTADEIAIAGSGNNSSGSSTASTASNASYKSFLKGLSDNKSWTMSPLSNAMEYVLLYGLYNSTVNYANSLYVRPAISLIHDVYVASGSGTATDPWTVSSQAPTPSRPTKLYKAIAKMSKGTQTAQDLEATISTSNSGVYEYNSSVFGADSDGVKQDNTKAKIYYYRGIIDDSFATSTYGSSGDGTLYPNYVVLATSSDSLSTSNTCWRIIRTTGSGGVKMIYNGNWTGSTCANSGTSAQAETTSFTNRSSNNTTNTRYNRQVVRVGYSYNSTYASTTNSSTSPDNIFFSNNSNYQNNTSNNIKTVVENWYSSNLSSYASLLETNAGYCNDRSIFSSANGTGTISTLNSYGASNGTNGAYFGPYTRNYNANNPPSLTCTRNVADVYSTSAASAGNKLLSSPIALITADEASFAGSGASTASSAYGSRYDGSSFLRTNSNFLTMSPSYRQSSSTYPAFVFYLNASGALTNNGGLTTNTYGVRPVISLKEGTEAVSGSGTATDPWIVVTP